MNPWWRRPAAEEKPGPARPETASTETEDEPRLEAVAEAGAETETAEDAGVEETAAFEPTDAPSAAALAAAEEAPEAQEEAAEEAGEASVDEIPAEQGGEPPVSAALEAATEPAEPARPAAGDPGEVAPPKRRRRRRRRSRRRGRGGGSQKLGEAGKAAEVQRPADVPSVRKSGGPRRAAALLDLGGLERSLDGGQALDPEGLLARLDGELGKLVLRRVYADASDQRLDRNALHGGGAEVVDVPSGTEMRGCSAAVRIVVDALELCYTKRTVDTMVLVATSVQMLPLVAKLQMNGVTVVGLGGPEGDAQVRAQCDRFIDLSG